MSGVFFIGRRRPNPLLVGYRWRYEAVVLAAAAFGWYELGSSAALLCVGVLCVVVAAAATWPGSRLAVVRAAQHVIVQHRLRTGFLQAGLANRDGGLPRIVWTRTRGDVVTLAVWLPAGLGLDELTAATDVLAGACGAAEVEVTSASPSRDRAQVTVVRPRWGLPG